MFHWLLAVGVFSFLRLDTSCPVCHHIPLVYEWSAYWAHLESHLYFVTHTCLLVHFWRGECACACACGECRKRKKAELCFCARVCGETCLSAPELGEVEPVGCGTPDKGDANTLTQDHREGEARQREGRRATQTPGLVLFSNLEEKKNKLFFFCHVFVSCMDSSVSWEACLCRSSSSSGEHMPCGWWSVWVSVFGDGKVGLARPTAVRLALRHGGVPQLPLGHQDGQQDSLWPQRPKTVSWVFPLPQLSDSLFVLLLLFFTF